MSAERAQDDIEAQQNDASMRDAPDGLASDNDYTSRVGQKQAPIPVQSDADAVADNNPDVVCSTRRISENRLGSWNLRRDALTVDIPIVSTALSSCLN